MADEKDETNGRAQSASALRALAFVMLAGAMAVVLFSCNSGSVFAGLASASAGLALGGAAILSGGLIGFVFAIPRTLQQGLPEGGAGESRKESSTWYQANTNLEQISDWLTKIIIGVSLVEIKELPALLQGAAAFARPGLGDTEVAERFAAIIMVYFLIAGFIFAYLWTRLYMVGALRTADTEGLGRRFAKVEKKLEELKTREALDVRALSLAQRQLEPNEEEPPIEQASLDDAIAKASNSAWATIFRQAENVRRSTWRTPADKPKMERTIQIFLALINADPKYHRDHAQLAYALKDRRNPSLKEAREELSKAIELRGAWEETGYIMYELNRAACMILLEREAGRSGNSPQHIKSAILEDLRVAAHANDLADIIAREEPFKNWLRENDVNPERLNL